VDRGQRKPKVKVKEPPEGVKSATKNTGKSKRKAKVESDAVGSLGSDSDDEDIDAEELMRKYGLLNDGTRQQLRSPWLQRCYSGASRLALTIVSVPDMFDGVGNDGTKPRKVQFAGTLCIDPC